MVDMDTLCEDQDTVAAPRALFQLGDRVRHKDFGDGTVAQVQELCGRWNLFVRFERTAIWVPGAHVQRIGRA